MRALIATGSASPRLQLREVAEPLPRHDEALVELRATSLNRGEVRRASSAADGWRPGWDVAGVVAAAAADGSGPPAGARVVGLVDGQGWAERVAVTTDLLAPLPDEVGFAAAATLPVAGLTALLALRRGGLALARRVAVTGATGGVGRFAVQLAALSGARVTAVLSASGRGEDELRRLGAAEVVVGLDADGAPFDQVLESVGGELLAAALRRIAPGGAVITFGNSSRGATSLDVSAFYGRHRARLEGFLLFAELERDPPAHRHLTTLAGLVAAGRLDPQVTAERSWRDADDAAAGLLQRSSTGKTVLHVD